MTKEERKLELMEYAKILATLKTAGMNYANETNQVIKELNSLINYGQSVIEKFKRNCSHSPNIDGRVVVLDGTDDRGVGKTTALIEMSAYGQIPIVVGFHFNKKYIEELSNEMKLNIPEVYVLQNNTVQGRKFPTGVLVEQCIGLEGIQLLKDNKIIIRGGFLHNKLFI